MNFFRRRREQLRDLSAKERDAAKVDKMLEDLRRRVGALEQVETVITVKTVKKR